MRKKTDGNRFFTYDAAGRLKSITSDGGATPLNYRLRRYRSSLDQLMPLVTRTSTFYDHRGLLLAERDANGTTTYLTYDDDLQLTGATDVSGASTLFQCSTQTETSRQSRDRLLASLEFTYATTFSSLDFGDWTATETRQPTIMMT